MISLVGVELDVGRFQLGNKCLEVFHVETDVIEDPVLRRPFRDTGLGPAQLDVEDRRVVALAPKTLPYQAWLASPP